MIAFNKSNISFGQSFMVIWTPQTILLICFYLFSDYLPEKFQAKNPLVFIFIAALLTAYFVGDTLLMIRGHS